MEPSDIIALYQQIPPDAGEESNKIPLIEEIGSAQDTRVVSFLLGVASSAYEDELVRVVALGALRMQVAASQEDRTRIIDSVKEIIRRDSDEELRVHAMAVLEFLLDREQAVDILVRVASDPSEGILVRSAAIGCMVPGVSRPRVRVALEGLSALPEIGVLARGILDASVPYGPE